MRVGIFTECYRPVVNGVAVSVDTFRRDLEKQGYDFYIFTTAYPGYSEKDDHIIRFPYWWPTKAKGSRYPIARPQNVRKVAHQVNEYNLDLIHCQHLLNMGSLGLKVAQRLGIPAILTYHTLMTEYVHYAVPIIKYSQFLRRKAQKWVIRKSRDYCNQFDQVVTPSPSMKRLLRSYGVTVPIELIPTGIDPEDFEDQYSQQELRARWNIPAQHSIILLCVSRIGKEKNIQFLLEAMRNLVLERHRQDCHLLMVGGGQELGRYRHLVADWQIANFVTFTDALPKGETNRTFGGADIFVLPSVSETQGIIVFEAMASGLPVVAINQMGPSDYVKDGVDGFLTDLKIEEFNDRIEFLLDDEDRRHQMGKNARQNIQNHTAEKSADKMEKLYEQTINHHRS